MPAQRRLHYLVTLGLLIVLKEYRHLASPFDIILDAYRYVRVVADLVLPKSIRIKNEVTGGAAMLGAIHLEEYRHLKCMILLDSNNF